MRTAALWPIALDAMRMLGEQYSPALEQAAIELDLPGGMDWLLAAMTFGPDPISAARLSRCNPYTALDLFNLRLEMAADCGFLNPVPEAPGMADASAMPDEEPAYCLSEKGWRAGQRILAAAYDTMAALLPMLPAELDQLEWRLRRWVIACLEAPEPPGKWCILHSRRLDPGDSAPVLVRIDQHLNDLAAYRDDAHLAAWQLFELPGPTWEAFTYLWKGRASTVDDLAQILVGRGHSREVYQQGLEELARRGWVRVKSRHYQLTGLGRTVREEVEAVTERYFDAPQSCFYKGEMKKLRGLFARFTTGLQGQPVMEISRVAG